MHGHTNINFDLVLFYNITLSFLNVFTFVSNISLYLRNVYTVDILYY